jgi:hypothetical protein
MKVKSVRFPGLLFEQALGQIWHAGLSNNQQADKNAEVWSVYSCYSWLHEKFNIPVH